MWYSIDNSTFEPLYDSWLYLLGPLLGALIASFYYSWFHFNATTGSGFFHEGRDNKNKENDES